MKPWLSGGGLPFCSLITTKIWILLKEKEEKEKEKKKKPEIVLKLTDNPIGSRIPSLMAYTVIV